jgi:hypothetical protein
VLTALTKTLAFSPEHKQRTILRSDAGFGSDANVNYALTNGWQVLAKGKGGRRPQAYARQVAADGWQDIGSKRWVAQVSRAPSYVWPTHHVLLRWQTETGLLKYSTLVCSIANWSLAEIIAHYDDRGSCETEIQADKGGLKLERRRKKHLAAQEILVLLTDLAHNLLTWTGQWMFPSGPLAQFGPTRLIEDVLSLPGRLRFDQQRLVEVQLNELHPHASAVAEGLERLLAHFGQP